MDPLLFLVSKVIKVLAATSCNKAGSVNSIGKPLLLTGDLTLLNLGSLRHTDPGKWPHFPLKQHQDRWSDLSSLLLPPYSWRRIGPEQYFTAAGLETTSTHQKYEVFFFGFGNSTVVHTSENDPLSIICHKTNTFKALLSEQFKNKENAQQEERFVTTEECAGTHSQLTQCSYITNIHSLNWIYFWMEFFNNTEKATKVFVEKCKYLRGLYFDMGITPLNSLSWPFLSRYTLDSCS